MYDGTSWIVTHALPQVWTPTLTNVVIGTGGSPANAGAYVYSMGVLSVDIVVVLGSSGFSVSGTPGITLPAGFVASRVSASMRSAVAVGLICQGNYRHGVANQPTAGALNVFAETTVGAYLTRVAITAAVPATWQAGDAIFINGDIKGTLS
jgi:hypothetical protein